MYYYFNMISHPIITIRITVTTVTTSVFGNLWVTEPGSTTCPAKERKIRRVTENARTLECQVSVAGRGRAGAVWRGRKSVGSSSDTRGRAVDLLQGQAKEGFGKRNFRGPEGHLGHERVTCHMNAEFAWVTTEARAAGVCLATRGFPEGRW